MSGHEGCGEDQSLVDYDPLIAAARAARDATVLVRLGGELERAGRYGLAWELLSEGGEIRRPPLVEPWRGPGSTGERLLVRRRIRHLGAELRNARFLACAARDVPGVTVATEARLIPLLQRSFPTIRFLDASDELAFADMDCETSYEGLACFYGRSEEEIEASFTPLRAPPPDASGGLGVAWHSSNGRKRLPSLADWASVLRSIGGRVQSLQ